MPTVSILTAAYAATAKYLPETIASVREQILPAGWDLECRVGSWRGSCRLRFQLPPVKPCMWFSHTRLSDIVHRQACAVR